MDIVYGLLIAFHVLVSMLLIVAVLLQPGRGGGGMGAVFGGGSSTSVFGGRGATTILSKATGVLTGVFFLLSILIAVTGSERSVTSEVADAPAAPTAPAPASAPAEAPATAPAQAPAAQ
jgi:preprotein translocase subunit SecG